MQIGHEKTVTRENRGQNTEVAAGRFDLQRAPLRHVDVAQAFHLVVASGLTQGSRLEDAGAELEV
jgi:hypothetical protein